MEENKVAQKLKQIVHDSYWGTTEEGCKSDEHGLCSRLTNAILQSPDLRVTLVEPEPRFSVTGQEWQWSVVEPTTEYVSAIKATFYGKHARYEALAHCSKLNSKELR